MTNGEKYKTAQDRAEAFAKHDGHPQTSQTGAIVLAVMNWLDLEAEEEKPLPCPFCGEDCTEEELNGAFVVRCYTCTYRGRLFESKEDAIAAHNRVAKAVEVAKAVKEGEVKNG